MDKQDVAQPRVLVLGIGNLVMSDDGIGVLVVQRLQRDYRLPGHVEVMDGGTLGLDILPRLEGIERLLIVDAVETGLAPGSGVRMAGDEIPVALETKVSPHQMGLKDLLAVAMLLGDVPQEMILVAVQPGSIEMGIELTAEVEAQLDHLQEMVFNELENWGIHPELV